MLFRSNYAAGDNPYSVFAADLDGDGDSDLAIANLTADNISILINQTDRVAIDDSPAKPNQFRLLQNYPNPFNPTTAIAYSLPLQSHVNIDIYNILGRKITTLVDENQPAGYHQVIWNAGNVSSGMYFYRIKTGDFTEARKMLLLK